MLSLFLRLAVIDSSDDRIIVSLVETTIVTLITRVFCFTTEARRHGGRAEGFLMLGVLIDQECIRHG